MSEFFFGDTFTLSLAAVLGIGFLGWWLRGFVDEARELEQRAAVPSAVRAAVAQAMERATAPVADSGNGWETTAAVLAYEVKCLRGDA